LLPVAFFSWCNRSQEKSCQERLAAGLQLRWLSHRNAVTKLRKINAHVLVCQHKTCLKQGGKATLKAFKRALKDRHLRDQVMVTKIKCLDQCGRGPVMVVYPDGVWYGGVNEEAAREIVSEHLGKGRAVEERVLRDMREGGFKERA
jgi:(2Fe-2S) ferredoxin